MIQLLIVGDADGSLGTREGRDAMTLSQLAALGVAAGELGRRCVCGSTDHGAPSAASDPSIGISRSRGGGWHAFAVSTASPVLGVDIEPASRAPQALRAAPRFVCAGDGSPSGDAGAALRAFMRKEAILKARGTGFHVDPHDQATSAVAVGPRWCRTQDGWWLHEREISDLLVCIAVDTPQPIDLMLEPGFDPARGARRAPHSPLLAAARQAP
ncbi:MAG: hypothetical protein QOF54_2160 [Solirubrobacteraceae bacterium]|nr:hypothetical protein [Solirubrobacteraceae bacterium]